MLACYIISTARSSSTQLMTSCQRRYHEKIFQIRHQRYFDVFSANQSEWDITLTLMYIGTCRRDAAMPVVIVKIIILCTRACNRTSCCSDDNCTFRVVINDHITGNTSVSVERGEVVVSRPSVQRYYHRHTRTDRRAGDFEITFVRRQTRTWRSPYSTLSRIIWLADDEKKNIYMKNT